MLGAVLGDRSTQAIDLRLVGMETGDERMTGHLGLVV
jgi:hypothetical protein